MFFSLTGFLDINYVWIILYFNLAMLILRATKLVQFSVDTFLLSWQLALRVCHSIIEEKGDVLLMEQANVPLSTYILAAT